MVQHAGDARKVQHDFVRYLQAYKNAIPKKKEGIIVYYSKKHVDIAKGIAKPEETMYYTVAEAMKKFNLTRDQLSHYVKWHHISKVKKGKYTFISRAELDKLLAPPKIEWRFSGYPQVMLVAILSPDFFVPKTNVKL